jgi:gluconate transporter
MPVIIILSGILILLILMLGFKINAFLSLIFVSLYIGFANGMETDATVASLQKGFGDTLGSLTFIVVLGAMLGKLVGESGAAQRISNSLTHISGRKNLVWAVVLTGFIVGIPLFYTAGFVLLIPLVFTIATVNNISPLYVGIPMAAALSVTHGFLPPHPGPVAIAALFHADLGKTLIYGSIIAVPSIVLAGPLFAGFVKNIQSVPASFSIKVKSEEELPGFGVSLLSALLPVILISAGSICLNYCEKDSIEATILSFFGNPVIAMLIAVVSATFFLGIARGKTMTEVMKLLNDEISGIALILLIIGAGGSFKQILIDSKAGDYIAEIFKSTEWSPLILAWTAAAVIRLALGSATVAALTAAGIILPVLGSVPVNAELMVLSIGAGSLMFSHVNDAGFWIFKEYFNLTIGQTIRSWSIMETIVSVTGLAGVLILDLLI